MSSDEEESSQSTEVSESDDLTSSDEEEPNDRSFGQAYNELLNTPVPSDKCPILCLSKIPARLNRKKEESNKKEREAVHLLATKKHLLNEAHVGVKGFDEDNENKLRKLGTRGTLTLFNQIANANIKKKEPEPESLQDDEAANAKQEEFLALLTATAVNK